MKRNTWIFLGAAVLVIVGAVGVYLGVSGPSSPKASGVAPGPSVVSPAGPGASYSNRLVIPSIGANAPVVPAGATGPDGGAFDVPSSVSVVGWWDGVWQSPNGEVDEKVASPGQPGVALLAGHIDSAVQGRGALYNLQQLKDGAAITVYGAKGKVTRWKVTGLQVVSKSALPASLFVNSGPPRLAIVSCGGPFDSATGHYADNVIAWASPA